MASMLKTRPASEEVIEKLRIDASFVWEIVLNDLLPLEEGCKAALDDLAKDRKGSP